MSTESDIRRELRLDEFAARYPVPPRETVDIVVTLDGTAYSSEAVYSALMNAPIDVLLEFLNYGQLLAFDFNVSGHQFRQQNPTSGPDLIGTEDFYNMLKRTRGPDESR